MSLDKLRELVSDNQEAIEIIDGVRATVNELTSKLNKLETDSKKAFSARDELKSKLNLVKNTFGLDEIDDDSLTKILKSKGNENEITNLKSLLEKTTLEKQEMEKTYKQKLTSFAVEQAIIATGLAQKADTKEDFEFLKSKVLNGLVYNEDGSISFVNEDGSTVYEQGKQLSIDAKVESLYNNPQYAKYFKTKGVGGTGANPNPNGGSGMQNNGDFIP